MQDLEYARTRDGSQVAYRVMSTGPGEPIVYLPGLVYSIESVMEDAPYARFIGGLCELGSVVMVERQGVGASDALDDSLDLYEQWADGVVAVLDQIEAPRARLVGYAIGGNIVLETAIRYADRVAAVVVFNPGVQIPDEVLDAMRGQMTQVVDRDESASRDAFTQAVPSRAQEQDYLDWNRRAGRQAASPKAAAQFWDVVLQPTDLRDRLGDIEAPVLFIARKGYTETMGATVTLADAVRSVPNASLVMLDGADLVPNAGDVDGLVFEIAEFIHGDRGIAKAARALTALLFTDLVGSTTAVRSMGDADWRKVLDRHDQGIERTVRRHGGILVKATGDGALATFDTPSRALNAAVALRDEINALGLGVRMGIHIGEIEGRGADVAGVAVHLAARVMAAADAGEILTTAAVPLASLGGGFEFVSCGHVALKGFDEDFELFRLDGGSRS